MSLPAESPAEMADDAAALVRQARDGSRAAFGRLYELHAGMVHGILLARVPRLEVDDLVQEVFLHAMKRLHDLREPAAFGAWLAQIARNRANDFHRAACQTKELPGELSVRATNSVGSPLPHFTANDPPRAEALAALAAVRELPEAYRETLLLRLVEGMTGPEIAARTGLTPASVRVNLHRGMKLLRESLGGTASHE
ncbi:MAG TPA: sigma-70 family RNA polymerase sigma factor [Candidatus Acidoferrales bacterium]|nr:sigma-70 family RNA polymerase sigma factor [Candidatus Acidoferrales bacterium]